MDLNDTISDNVPVEQVITDLEAYPVGSLARYIARELADAVECLGDLETALDARDDVLDDLREARAVAARIRSECEKLNSILIR